MKQKNLWAINYLDMAGRSGIHIDLETLKNFNVHATLMTTTAKDCASSLSVLEPIAQITKLCSVLKDQRSAPEIIKMGLISHQRLFEKMENFLSKYSGKLILDPLFFSHTDTLFDVDSKYLANFIKLFPYADILICNLLEVEKILNITLNNTYQAIKDAARSLLKLGAKSILIKGGQLKKGLFCQDFWSNSKESFWLATPYLTEKPIDKKGIFSAAIAACLARDYSLKDAIVIARMYVQRGLRKAYVKNKSIKFFHNGWPDEQIDLPYLGAKPLLKFPQAFTAYQPGLYPIVDSSQWVERLLAQRVKSIQLRIKNANLLWIEQEIQRSVLLAKKYQVQLFINDYWKLAIQFGATGVHLGQEDLATADIDEIYRSGLYLGVSTHCYYEVACAHAINPSYIACGPIYLTQSKRMSFQAQGILQLNYWRRMLDYSLVAIGGITLARLSDVLQSGVNGVAVISAITQANDPGTVSQKFLMEIQKKMQNELSSEEILRYTQHIKLAEIGLSGQKKLKSARVLIVGLGGLGSPIAIYLAAAGIGTLGVVDHDTVELTNLQRQILYRTQHLGQYKTTSAEEQILALNPTIKIQSYTEKLTAHNADALISQYDIIADGSDNFATHYLIHDTCFKYNKPYVYASAGQFQGYSSVFYADHQNPCLRCLFPEPPAQKIPNCEAGGVFGVLPGLLGIIQATEIIKYLLNRGDALIKRLLVVDLLKMTFNMIQLSKNPNCKLCVYHESTQESRLMDINSNDNPLEKYALSAQQFIQLLQKSNVSLVDVRSEVEHKDRNIGGQLIPLEELSQRLHELNSQHIIILYCLSGKRSQSAVEILIAAGFTSVKYLCEGAGEFF